MARKPLTDIEREYRKQRSRVQKALREAEKQGFVFKKTPIPKEVKHPTEKSIARLKAINLRVLKGKAWGHVTDTGEAVTIRKWKKLTGKPIKVKGKVKKEAVPGLARKKASKKQAKKRKAERAKAGKKRGRPKKQPKQDIQPKEVAHEPEEEQIQEQQEEPIPEQPPQSRDVLNYILNAMEYLGSGYAGTTESARILRIHYSISARAIVQGLIDDYGEDVVARNAEKYAVEIRNLIDKLLSVYDEDEFTDIVSALYHYLSDGGYMSEEANELWNQVNYSSVKDTVIDDELLMNTRDVSQIRFEDFLKH